jgi:stage II sporulation protein D
MVDVSSLVLSSASRLQVRSQSENTLFSTVSSESLRFETVKLSTKPNAPKRSSSDDKRDIYSAQVSATSDVRRAVKLADEVKKKFSEPVGTVFDEKEKKHRVFTGRFGSREKAAEMVSKLQRAGYFEARVIHWATGEPSIAPEPVRTDIKNAAKRTTATNSRDDRSQPGTPSRKIGVAAMFDDKVVATNDSVLIVAADKPYLSHAKPTGASSAKENRSSVTVVPTIRVGNSEYRGEIHLLVNARGKLNVINVLPLEEYLRGVVPLELPPASYPELEALKAQAIAARSYALATRGRLGREGFDLYDDPRSQIYGGYKVEHPMSNRAVEETHGLVATFSDKNGKVVPIEALYSADCGGHTENNESVFMTSPVPYLRAVDCSPNSQSGDRQLVAASSSIAAVGSDGRSKARDLALLQSIGLKLPRPTTSSWLIDRVEQDEVRDWCAVLARAFGNPSSKGRSGNPTRLSGFSALAATSIYGERNARMLITSKDVDNLIKGLDAEDLSDLNRAEIALLIRDNILRLSATDGRVDIDGHLTRESVLETLSRAFQTKAIGFGQISSSNRRLSSALLYRSTALPTEENRLRVQQSSMTKGETRYKTSPAIASNKRDTPATIRDLISSFELDQDVRLFRRIGTETYSIDRVAVTGGEQVTYHLNPSGKIDFLEVEKPEPGAPGTLPYQWKERLTPGQVSRRLGKIASKVGEIRDLIPERIGDSSRVVELTVMGTDDSVKIRGFQIRSRLGLKDNMFIIERERDDEGRIVAFVFNGRGWGHGVGLCQVGSYRLAKAGFSYLRILQKYYAGVRVQRLY